MKKKLFLLALMVALFACVLVISVSAKDIATGYYDSNGNEIVVPTYDENGDSLLWMRRDKSKGAPTTQAIVYYECTDEDGTEYYLFSRKAKDSISVNSNYSFSFKSNIGITTGNVVIMNLDGIAHSDGTGVQRFAFTMQNNTSLQYVYFPASFTSTKNINDNKQVFLGNSALEVVEFAPGSKITELGPSAFKSCAITEIVLPEGLTFIDERAFDDCTRLEKIYIPRGVTFIDEIAFRGVVGAKYYFTGTEETTSGWEITNEITYVNHCDVYYGGEHVYEDDGDCTTALECERCLSVIEAAADVHDNQIVVEYANGFMSVGVKKDGCVKCSAYVTETIEPLFTCLGYSFDENGNGGISVGYNINKAAILEYEELTGTEVSYGLFAGTKAGLGTDDVIGENGEAVAGAITAGFKNSEYSYMFIKMFGFDTDVKKSAEFAIGAYVEVTDEESKTYSYLQVGAPNENEKYEFIKYIDFKK